MKHLQTILLVGLFLVPSSLLLAQSVKGGAADHGVIGKVRVDATTGKVVYNAQGQPVYDTFGKCDEQYYSAIQLTLKREKAAMFSIGGGKGVEFSTGNLQYCPKTKTFRFADRQWYYCGNGDIKKHQTMEIYDSVWVKGYDTLQRKVDKLNPDGSVLSSAGTKDSIVSLLDTVKAYCSNTKIGQGDYQGWIDLFGWGTSGYGSVDATNTCFLPTSTSTTGYGPEYGAANKRNIDTVSSPQRFLDWGQANDIYCKWVSYDTINNGDVFVRDIQVIDSTLFRARTFVPIGKVIVAQPTPVWRTLTADEWKIIFSGTRNVADKNGVSVDKPWARVIVNFPNRLTGGNNNTEPVEGLLIFPDDCHLTNLMHQQSSEYPDGILGTTFRDANNNFKFGDAAVLPLNTDDYYVLEKAGVVFLPFTGQRNNDTRNNCDGLRDGNTAATLGHYWSASASASVPAPAQVVDIASTTPKTLIDEDRSFGNSVRLVHDIEDPNTKSKSIYAKMNPNHKEIRNIKYKRLNP